MTDTTYGGYYQEPPSDALKRQLRVSAEDAANRIVSEGLMKVRRVEVTIYYTNDTTNHVTSVAPI